MKRVLIGFLVAMLLITGVAFAKDVVVEEDPLSRRTPVDVSDWLNEVPYVKQGAVYSFQENDIKYCSTIRLIETRYLDLEVGIVPSDNEIIGVISYELLKAKDYVDAPLLDLIELNVGVFGGVKDPFDADEYELECGLSATFVNVKF